MRIALIAACLMLAGCTSFSVVSIHPQSLNVCIGVAMTCNQKPEPPSKGFWAGVFSHLFQFKVGTR